MEILNYSLWVVLLITLLQTYNIYRAVAENKTKTIKYTGSMIVYILTCLSVMLLEYLIMR